MEKSVSVTFCTIITQSHLAWALALNHSLLQFDEEMSLSILVTDCEKIENPFLSEYPNVKLLYIKDLISLFIAKRIIHKYKKQSDVLRWALKPALMMYLLQMYEKVLYCDCDIFFYDSYHFLVNELAENDILLSPHWRTIEPQVNVEQFEAVLWGGIFNGGFVAANKNGYSALKIWADLCCYKCEKDKINGYYDDQKYLDLLPIYCEKVKIIAHKGCNIANWNIETCKRSLQKNGEVWINETYPIVFIHLTKSTIYGTLLGNDSLLLPYIQHFQAVIERYNPNFKLLAQAEKEIETLQLRLTFFQRIKNKLYQLLHV